jgi:hypothetical protein
VAIDTSFQAVYRLAIHSTSLRASRRLNQLRDDPVVAVDTTTCRPLPCSPVDDV